MSQNYTPEFKKKIVRLHEEEGRTYKSITAEYGVSKPASPSGAANSAKNARPTLKPRKIMTP
ncbi:MAG: transposase [Lachnospiraceae bacterium]|nr:transposase [Lachnospiraceae bacterium]